jgi:methylsterol monooxygenase
MAATQVYNVAMDFLSKHAPAVAEQLVITNATTTREMLYPDVNFETLNWAERMWADYYISMGNAILATGLMSFLLHEVSREQRAEREVGGICSACRSRRYCTASSW